MMIEVDPILAAVYAACLPQAAARGLTLIELYISSGNLLLYGAETFLRRDAADSALAHEVVLEEERLFRLQVDFTMLKRMFLLRKWWSHTMLLHYDPVLKLLNTLREPLVQRGRLWLLRVIYWPHRACLIKTLINTPVSDTSQRAHLLWHHAMVMVLTQTHVKVWLVVIRRLVIDWREIFWEDLLTLLWLKIPVKTLEPEHPSWHLLLSLLEMMSLCLIADPLSFAVIQLLKLSLLLLFVVLHILCINTWDFVLKHPSKIVNIRGSLNRVGSCMSWKVWGCEHAAAVTVFHNELLLALNPHSSAERLLRWFDWCEGFRRGRRDTTVWLVKVWGRTCSTCHPNLNIDHGLWMMRGFWNFICLRVWVFTHELVSPCCESVRDINHRLVSAKSWTNWMGLDLWFI